ncbi:MAG: tRNA preQ1(34) S-adenosylmethionine ribosyltransferase-isomerase QueA [Pelagibacteraceae bacterium]|nr:tRNA preQ1(34) S-adenosylmethionine ribosyltransferase-isomerase QueA [Pelagibacteraceae bacterium]|tara:strand:- start:7513 stop:8526 length:1014 start_codon:yes stop_codon:yes gene_type:complete
MDISHFDFDLPKELIASRPIHPRNISRLLIGDNTITHDNFNNILNYIEKDDLFVVNNSKVIPAYFSVKFNSGHINITLHKKIENSLWRAFIKPGKKINSGDKITLDDKHFFKIIKKFTEGDFLIEMNEKEEMIFKNFGKMPLPPYILKSRSSDEKDFDDYQTVYASQDGSIAAPTAGLHFNSEIYNKLQNNNQLAEITLHVGAGTFMPIRDKIENHKMHSENGFISDEVIEIIKEKKSKKGRIISVGTTSLRLLESAAMKGELTSFSGDTDIFIRPGFRFNVVDMLLTNFHLPKSSLMILVSAFAGIDKVKLLYKEAIKNNYRFFSYGDASLLFRHE